MNMFNLGVFLLAVIIVLLLYIVVKVKKKFECIQIENNLNWALLSYEIRSLSLPECTESLNDTTRIKAVNNYAELLSISIPFIKNLARLDYARSLAFLDTLKLKKNSIHSFLNDKNEIDLKEWVLIKDEVASLESYLSDFPYRVLDGDLKKTSKRYAASKL